MQTKLLEVRDRATLIPVMATQVFDENVAQRALLRHAGYSLTDMPRMVILTRIAGGTGQATCDPYDWGGSRTLTAAHQWIIDHWDELEDGSVVCVEFIKGERDAPKASELL